MISLKTVFCHSSQNKTSKQFIGLRFVVLPLIAALCIFAFVSCRRDGERQYVIDVAMVFNAGTIEYYAVAYFQRLVQEGSDGRINVRLFPGAALGSEMDNVEQVRSGLVQMSIFGDVLTSQLAAEYDVAVIPFAFPTYDDVAEAWAGPLGDLIQNALLERGNQFLVGIQKRGSRKLTASRPITTPADLVGLRLRIPEVPSWVVVWGGLGTIPTPVTLAEVYTALQTGVVDAQENPVAMISMFRFFEVNRYIINTDHIHGKYRWSMNIDFFNSLPAEFQTLILDSARIATEWGDQRLNEDERMLIEELVRHGVTFVDVDRQQFVDAARPHLEQVAAGMAPLAREIIHQFF